MKGRQARRAVSVERLIPAPAERVFAVLADPSKHPLIDGSGTVRAAAGGVDRLQQGSRFTMTMSGFGFTYRMENTVVEFEEGRRIAWRNVGGQRWRYETVPEQGGTRVRETFDYSQAISPLALELARFPTRNRRAMERSLARLERLVTAAPPRSRR